VKKKARTRKKEIIPLEDKLLKLKKNGRKKNANNDVILLPLLFSFAIFSLVVYFINRK